MGIINSIFCFKNLTTYKKTNTIQDICKFNKTNSLYTDLLIDEKQEFDIWVAKYNSSYFFNSYEKQMPSNLLVNVAISTYITEKEKFEYKFNSYIDIV